MPRAIGVGLAWFLLMVSFDCLLFLRFVMNRSPSNMTISELDCAKMRVLMGAARRDFNALPAGSTVESVDGVFRLGASVVRRYLRRERHANIRFRSGAVWQWRTISFHRFVIRKLKRLQRMTIDRYCLGDITGQAVI